VRDDKHEVSVLWFVPRLLLLVPSRFFVFVAVAIDVKNEEEDKIRQVHCAGDPEACFKQPARLHCLSSAATFRGLVVPVHKNSRETHSHGHLNQLNLGHHLCKSRSDALSSTEVVVIHHRMNKSVNHSKRGSRVTFLGDIPAVQQYTNVVVPMQKQHPFAPDHKKKSID